MGLLVTLPWWCSIITTMLAYVGLRYLLPELLPDRPFFLAWKTALPKLAPVVATLLLIPAPISAFNSYRKRKQLDTQSGLESIRSLSWKQFEELVGEVYRRRGYKIRENRQGGADGGIDIKLEKRGQLHLVQCKHWKSRRIGVRVIREMYGVMVDAGAASVAIVATGTFTQEAETFASGKPIELVDGTKLAALVRDVRSFRGNSSAQGKPTVAPDDHYLPSMRSVGCPRCGNELVTRTARRGQNAGKKFVGCSSFPKCRYTQAV